MSKYRRFQISNGSFTYADTIVLDFFSRTLVYASIIGYSGDINVTIKNLSKQNPIYIEGLHGARFEPKAYDFIKKKESCSDYVHCIIYKKDIIKYENEIERLLCYVFYDTEEEKQQAIYNKLYNNTPVPILKEWMPYIIERMETKGYLKETLIYSNSVRREPFQAYSLNITTPQLIDIVTEGLKGTYININNSYIASEKIKEVNGLDSYLSGYSEILAEKIQKSFIPKFIPGKSAYDKYVNRFDDFCYFNGKIELYEAQKCCIQASVNNLKKEKYVGIIGEMGVGKTILGAGVPYSHAEGKGYNAIVLCPSHLVKKWRKEIKRTVPHAKPIIVENLKEFMKLEKIIKNKQKREGLYIIMSKETAKFGYEKRPAVNWSYSKNRRGAWICPECGKVLTKVVKIGTGKDKIEMVIPLDKRDFVKEYRYNTICTNDIKIWDKSKNRYVHKPCGAKLWQPTISNDKTEWIKLGKEGWIYKKHIETLFNDLIEKDKLNPKDSDFLAKLSEVKDKIETDQKIVQRAPRKYPLASYIKKYYKGYIDYLIGDEVHELKGEDSKQGEAFGDLSETANKVITLTGTLLNGYANGIFYILYRTIPQVMKKEGFDYYDSEKFLHAFGVVKKNIRFNKDRYGKKGKRIGSLNYKPLPGVSPIVFTKFLLNNSVFVSLSDMSEALPSYEEIPIGIEMDDELKENYDNLEKEFKSHIVRYSAGSGKIAAAMFQTLSIFPDMPYNIRPIRDSETGDIIITPPSLENRLRNKEETILELIKAKVEAEEKVLLYYEFTNATDVGHKIQNMLEEEGIKTLLLEAKNAKAKDREEYIKQKVDENIKVMICNPKLVKTGLDLLDFTTIICYEMGYDVFTVRQANRRSWRISQTKPIEVYFPFYKDTVQEQILSLMAGKLQASLSIEGKFSEEGLKAMSNNNDILTQIANNVVNGIKSKINIEVFKTSSNTSCATSSRRKRREYMVASCMPIKGLYAKENPTIKKLLNNEKLLANLY